VIASSTEASPASSSTLTGISMVLSTTSSLEASAKSEISLAFGIGEAMVFIAQAMKARTILKFLICILIYYSILFKFYKFSIQFFYNQIV